MAQEPLVIKKKTEKSFKDIVMEKLPDGGNLNACLTCGTCAAGCPATGMAGMDPRKVVRMAALGMDEELKKTPWAWMCSMCTRCIHACPMNVNIPGLVFNMRASWPRDQRPRGILRSCDAALGTETNSAMGFPVQDFVDVVEEMLEVVREEPGFEELQAPIDKKGAYFLLNQNSREPGTEPEEMIPLWKILHMVGADWTYSSKGWAAENYCMFLADDDSWKEITKRSAEAAEELGVKSFVNTEWGHITFAVRVGLQKFKIPHNFAVESIIPYYAQWIKEGKLKVSSDWNQNLKVKFTVQDPCNLVRKTFGDALAEDLRFVLKSCVGEENFIDMNPNMSNNYCCGGGGGFLQNPYKEERIQYGQKKLDQIVETDADYCITPCHNCHSQIHELAGMAPKHWATVHLWTIICLAAGVLCRNERTYLHDDLKEVNIPEWDETEFL